jgi:hypothetical protein
VLADVARRTRVCRETRSKTSAIGATEGSIVATIVVTHAPTNHPTGAAAAASLVA